MFSGPDGFLRTDSRQLVLTQVSLHYDVIVLTSCIERGLMGLIKRNILFHSVQWLVGQELKLVPWSAVTEISNVIPGQNPKPLAIVTWKSVRNG